MGIAERIKDGLAEVVGGLRRQLSYLRPGEIIVLQGTPLMGVILSVSNPAWAMIPVLAVFMAASILLVAHIWALNDWADFREDQVAQSKSSRAGGTKVTRAALVRFSIGLLVASLALFCLLPLRTLAIAGIVALLGFIYSYRGVRAKELAGLSTLSHLAGGSFHFLLGYSLFHEIDLRGFLISLFFAMVFTAGHATQEVQDYEDDRSSGVRTNAVVFGKKPVFLAAFAIFSIAFLYLAVLAGVGVVPARLGFSALLLPLQAVWTYQAWQGGLTREHLERLRTRYRVGFGLIGLNMLSVLIWPG